MPNIDIAIYNDLQKWQNKHLANDTAMIKSLDAGCNEDTVFQLYNEKKEEIGTSFNFLEGKDANNEQDYQQQLEKLAQGELLFHDIDNDGEVSKSEYILKEVGSYNNYLNDDEAFQAIMYSYVMFNIIDSGMEDSIDDDSLTRNEFEHLYINLDKYQGLDETGTPVMSDPDGVLDIDSAGSFCFDIPNYYNAELIEKALECYQNNDLETNNSDDADTKNAKTLARFCFKTLNIIKKYS